MYFQFSYENIKMNEKYTKLKGNYLLYIFFCPMHMSDINSLLVIVIVFFQEVQIKLWLSCNVFIVNYIETFNRH